MYYSYYNFPENKTQEAQGNFWKTFYVNVNCVSAVMSSEDGVGWNTRYFIMSRDGNFGQTRM